MTYESSIQGERETAAGAARIVVTRNGPYLPDGSIAVVDHLGVPIAAEAPVRLCRCGQSQTKPFCDDSHVRLEFTGNKDPRRVPDKLDVYAGQQAYLFDNRGTCAHSGFCTDRLNSVFHLGQEPFVSPSGARLDDLVNAVRKCPSGTLGIGIGSSRLIAKVSSAQAKPNGVLWIVPGEEAKFLAPLDVRAIPGVGKVMESHLRELGIKKVGDLARLEESELEQRFGKWGLALAGKARGEDAGGWFDTEVGADTEAKSISHEHTFNEDTADANQLEATLMRLSEMVARRLREANLHTRTIQLKLRYKDFTTITRAHTLPAPTQLDGEIFAQVRTLFYKNWKPGREVRLLGVQASSFEQQIDQMNLLEGGRQQRWKDALAAADRLRDKFGESSVKLAAGMRGSFRERTHESPAGLPGKGKQKPD